MNDTFAIGIPTLNRTDLLSEALKKYVNDFPGTEIYILDNGNQGTAIYDFKDLRPESCITLIGTGGENYGVARSWNSLCKMAFSDQEDKASGKPGQPKKNILMLNDDIYLGWKESHILQMIEKFKDDDFIIGEKGWCSFVLPKRTFEAVGGFDEEFWPAYFEDGDYRYRMQLQGMSYITAPELTPVYFRESMTRQKDPSLNQYFEKNKIRYNEKWGGLPELEMYDFPFNIRPK